MRITFLTSVAVAATLLAAAPAKATPVIQFGQVSGNDTITGAVNGANTVTTITGTDVAISITQLLGYSLPPDLPAFFDLTATSVGSATSSGIPGIVGQAFSGTFSITSGAGDTGTNYLSGSFTDAVFGSGSALTLNVSATDGESATFTSDVIAASALASQQSLSLSFTDVSPSASIDGSTLAPFQSTVSGNASATAVPEPMTLALLGSGLAGFGLIRRRRRKV